MCSSSCFLQEKKIWHFESIILNIFITVLVIQYYPQHCNILILSAPSAKPNISDIRLDRTPTDDEIDVLWDRVRDCLQETPTGSARSAPVSSARSAPVDSVRSAPGDLQQQFVTENKPTINNSSLPPKPPIKKVMSPKLHNSICAVIFSC